MMLIQKKKNSSIIKFGKIQYGKNTIITTGFFSAAMDAALPQVKSRAFQLDLRLKTKSTELVDFVVFWGGCNRIEKKERIQGISKVS
jgi:hypothetical protein